MVCFSFRRAGPSATESGDDADADADELYRKLETAVAPAYADRHSFAELSRYCIALNGSHFQAHRMLRQYAHGPYELAYGGTAEPA